MLLTRTSFEQSGIYGLLTSEDGSFSCVTLEHAFLQPDGSYAPITNPGAYTCILGEFTLVDYPPGQYYQITGVIGHTHVLIHFGNYNANSDGCVLVGQSRVGDMVTNSDKTFKSFMAYMNGVNSFTLTIS
jgi:Family of unknown function (DUF5675)